jgi:peptidoglycan-N-acetylglucosamine deacetylase
MFMSSTPLASKKSRHGTLSTIRVAERACLLFVLGLNATGHAEPHAARGPAFTEEQRGPTFRCGSPDKRAVALTFDDGPNRRFTPKVLAILKEHHVKATFFVLGQLAKKNPDLIRRIADEGHLVAIHSWDHPRRASLEEWRVQLRRSKEAIVRAGVKPGSYFRPPHGTVTPAVRRACAEESLLIVLYTLLSSDWTRPGSAPLIKQVVGTLAAGGIVVLHDGGGDRTQTVEALPAIIRGLRQKELEPVRLDELLCPAPKVETCARGRR